MQGLPIVTERLLLREFRMVDAESLFEMESDPEVLTYLMKAPLKELQEIIPYIEGVQKQYQENGIGRWVMIEKQSGEIIGWTGLKLETLETNGFTNYIDLGYRMKPKFWGKGYATESSLVSVKYGFDILGVEKICGAAHVDNIASNKVLQKAGLKFINRFEYETEPHNWYELTK